MDINFIINKIKLENKIYSDAELAQILKVTPSAISNWKARENVPVSVIKKYCFEHNKNINDYITETEEFLNVKSVDNAFADKNKKATKVLEGKKMAIKTEDYWETTQQLINYQKKEIVELKEKNQILEANNLINPIPKLYEKVQPDFKTVVKLRNIFSFKSIERCIESIDYPEVISEALKINKKDLVENYFMVGKWVNSLNHSINKIINEKSLKELQSVTKQIPQQHKLYKFTFSAFYMRFFIMYEHNGNSLITESICKINWSTNPIVETKNIIIKS
jgi:hypothetical protein